MLYSISRKFIDKGGRRAGLEEPNPLTPFPSKEGGTEKRGQPLPFEGGNKKTNLITVGGVEPFKGSTDFPNPA